MNNYYCLLNAVADYEIKITKTLFSSNTYQQSDLPNVQKKAQVMQQKHEATIEC